MLFIDTHAALIRSSVQIAWRRPWNGVSFRSASMGTFFTTSSSTFPLALAAQEVAGDLLHRDQPDALLPAGVERLVQGRVLVEPRGVLEHDRVDDAPLGRRLEDLGPVLVVVEMPTSRALPDFLIASAVSLNSWLLTKFMASSSEWLSPKLWTKKRST